MSEPKSTESKESRALARRPDRLVEFYREIGISAVVAAFCIVSDHSAAKGKAPDEDRAVLPAFLQLDDAAE